MTLFFPQADAEGPTAGRQHAAPMQLFGFPTNVRNSCCVGACPASDSAPSNPRSIPMTRRRLSQRAKAFLCVLIIHRKAAWSFSPLAIASSFRPNQNSDTSGEFPSGRRETQTFPLRSGEQRGFRGVEGGGRKVRPSPQKIPFAIFSPFCFMRGSVELATFFARTGRARPRFFSTKS